MEVGASLRLGGWCIDGGGASLRAGWGLVGYGGVGDYAAAHGVDGGAGRRGQVTSAGRLGLVVVRRGGGRGTHGEGGGGDLVQQVDELLDRADEIAGGEVGGLGQDTLKPGAARPAIGGPGEAEVGLAQERQLVVLLQLVQLAPGADGGGQCLGEPALGQPGRLDVVGLARLERQGRDAGGQLGGGQAVPQAAAQALGGQQVELAV